jgi:pimeloyl-ACP methyl ester carboxylesterase
LGLPPDDEALVGIHVNFPAGIAGEGSERTEAETRWLADTAAFMADGGGYIAIQGTRPQTLAFGLHDSPVGQLAWIVEKFKEWTHAAELPEDAVDRDRILTNVMFYWLTGTAGSSARLYYENMHAGSWGQQPATPPTGVAVFAEDIAIRRYGERGHTIVHWSEFDGGGHFAALEAPDLLVGDVRAFFRRFRA